MYQYVVVGDLIVQTSAVTGFLAMLAAMWIVLKDVPRYGYDRRFWSIFVVVCTVVGWIGSHVLYMFTHLDLPSRIWWLRMADMFSGGYVWYGGFLASAALVTWTARWKKIPLLRMYDISTFAVLIAQPIGRVGCFFNHCCYGKPTASFLGILDFQGVPRHPTQLYEAAYLLAVCAVLWALRRRNPVDGLTFARYLLLQPAGRFVIEFFRGDEVRGFVVGWLSTSQFIAGLLFVLGAALWLHLSAKRSAP